MNNIYKILVAVFLLVNTNINAQSSLPTFQWTKQAGEGAFDYGYAIGTDSAGNVYAAGKYELNANFGNTWVPCAGNHDIYVAKYSPTGEFKWVRTAGGVWGDYARAVSVDAAGNVYVTGEIEMNCEFNGTGVILYSHGDNDIFVAKYNTNGDMQWAKKIGGGPNSDRGYGITQTSEGVYVTGNFQGACVFNENIPITSIGRYDIFVAKYSLDGVFQWIKTAGGSSDDEGWAISSDLAGNLYATGYFSGTANFSGTNISSRGGADAFIAKYNSAGNLLWVTNAGGSSNDYGRGIAVDKLNNIFITGGFRNRCYFGSMRITSAGSDDIFTARYNSSGTPLWAKRAGGSSGDFGRAITVDPSSNVTITGYFGNSADFGGTNINGADGAEIYVASYDVSGNFKWVLKADGPADPSDPGGGLQEAGYSICADRWNNIYASGAYRSNSVFGNTTLTKWDHTDIFISKIGITNTKPTASIISPAAGLLYHAGDNINFSGNGTDLQDGTLPASAFNWKLELHNGTQINPGPIISPGIKNGSFIIPTTGEASANVYYRLILVVTDAQGLKDTVFTDINPRTSNLSLASQPSGLQLLLDGQAHTTPYSVSAVSGMTRALGVTTPQTLNGTSYIFDHWLQGGSVSQNIMIDDSNKTYTAIFNANGVGATCFSSGIITRDFWANVTGPSIADIPVNTAPTSTSQLTIFEGPSQVADFYGSRIRGYICPPATGDYIFWIASDDKSELWLSTNDQPANKIKIASSSLPTGSREWTKYPTQQSIPISLMEGTKYYIEALHKEGTLGDNLSVGWQLPNGTLERPIPGTRLSPFGNPLMTNITSPVNYSSFNIGSTIIIKAAASGGTGTIQKVEFFAGTTKLGEILTSPYNFTWTNAAAGSYALTAKVTDSGNNTAVSAITNVTVISCVTPFITPLGPLTMCSGSVTLTTNSDPANLYQWIRNGTNITGATGSTYIASAPDNYQVKVIQGSCISWSAPVIVKIQSGLSASITPSGPTSFCPGGNVKLFANTCAGYTYEWKKDGVIISGATDALYTATSAGNYQVKINQGGVNAWSSLLTVVVNNCIGSGPDPGESTQIQTNSELSNAFQMNVYPNPNTGLFTIALNMPSIKEEKVQMKIVNIVGQVVYNKEYVIKDNYFKEIVELDKSLPTGIYTLEVVIGNKVENTSIVLSK